MATKPTAKPGNQLVLIGQDSETVGGLFKKLTPHLQKVMPTTVSPERLLEIAMFTLRSNPSLAECTRGSFLAAIVQCAKLNLYPELEGQCYLIPRKTGPMIPGQGKAKEAHFQMGYRGLMILARRSRDVKKIEARIVYDGDYFEYEYGTSPFIKHKPQRGSTPGALVASYAVGYIIGEPLPQFVVCEPWDIEKAMAASRNVDGKDSPWVNWEPQMWMKVSIARLCTYLPSNVELQRVGELEGRTAAEKSQHLDIELLPQTDNVPSNDNGLTVDAVLDTSEENNGGDTADDQPDAK